LSLFNSRGSGFLFYFEVSEMLKEYFMKSKAIFGGIFSILLVFSLVLTGCPGPTDPEPVAPAAPSVVTIDVIPGVTVPVRGQTPVTAITATDQYTGTITWSPAVSGTFAEVTAYTATITLTAKTGYTLTGVTKDFFTVAGATATNPVNSGVVTAVFPATEPPATIDIAAIPGSWFPVKDQTPIDAIEETEQYTGTITWAPAVSGTFTEGTVYTATITLTA
jgi:hypothetical protein